MGDNSKKVKLLIIQPMVGIGDMIWHKPWLDVAIERHEVSILAKPSSYVGAIFGVKPSLKIFYLHRSQRGVRGVHDGILGFFRLVVLIRKSRVDEVWILHRSWRYAAASLIAGIKNRSGYGLGKQEWFLNSTHFLDAALMGKHPRLAVANFMKKKDIETDNDHPVLKPTPAALKEAKRITSSWKSFVIFGVGAADSERRWSHKNFVELAKKISDSGMQLDIVLCGSADEKQIGCKIISGLSESKLTIHPIFDQSVEVVIALHTLALHYVGNDTGLINISAAVGTRCTRIFASNLPTLDSPLIETLWPERPERIGVLGSIDDVSPERVFREMRRRIVQ